MKSFTRFGFALLMIGSVVISSTQPTLACGPYTTDPVFGYTKHGEYPLAKFTGGSLGLVPTSYGRISLFVSYRYLTNTPLSESEQKEVAKAMRHRIGIDHDPLSKKASPEKSEETANPVREWIDIRAKLVSDVPEINQYKALEDGYGYYNNCLGGAFENAAVTLTNRIAAKYDENLLREWIKGQDTVFSNCKSAGVLPQRLPDSFPVWIRNDREYQIAAAYFYRDSFAEARKSFEQIAADKSSVWSKTAKYLVARTYIREASFQEDDAVDAKLELLSNAANQLARVIDDKEMPDLQRSAKNLLNLVKLRMDPVERTKELAETLSSQTANTNVFNDLTDYILLLDKMEDQAEQEASKSNRSDTDEPESFEDYWTHRIYLRDIPSEMRPDDLTDWLITYQAQDGLEHSLEKWRETGKPHWLASAIAKVSANSEASNDLIKSAIALPNDSPSYPTAVYHAIRVLREGGDDAGAEKLTKSVFDRGLEDLPTATQNSFFAQRTPYSKNLDEFLTYAKRTPTGFVSSFDGNEAGETADSIDDLIVWKGRSMFGEDAVELLNKQAPLSVWLKAANHPQVPGYLRDFVASAGWTRAFLLKDKKMEESFAPLAARYSQDYAPLFQKYLNARSVADKEAAALILISRYAVIEPSVPYGWGRKDSEPTTIDSNRGNWWCLDKTQTPDGVRPLFLSPQEYRSGAGEFKRLNDLGEGATAIANRAVEFANRYPRHRQTPEILHLAVRATRYGCRDDNTGTASQAAFKRLHTRYRSSVWASKTKFWFQ